MRAINAAAHAVLPVFWCNFLRWDQLMMEHSGLGGLVPGLHQCCSVYNFGNDLFSSALINRSVGADGHWIQGPA
ncbi:hypothetical protein MJ577_11385 [Escherichia coli]|nr:hypothetical protein MJ577_11385 [Escherichia coli]